MIKKKFKRRFIKNTFTRFHMSLILLGTILSGVIYSKILLVLGLEHMLVRFIVVLILAYASFFLLLKLWLIYLTRPYRKNSHGADWADAADVITNIPDFLSSNNGQAVSGHGGQFGGAGASGAWDNACAGSNLPVSGGALEVSDAIGETTAETAGSAISGLADEGGILLIPLAILIAVIFGGSIYLIYEAPIILSEAAFELILATSLIKKAKKIDTPNWVGSVFKSTWPALSLTLVITLIAGWGLMAYCPQATKIKEVFLFCT